MDGETGNQVITEVEANSGAAGAAGASDAAAVVAGGQAEGGQAKGEQYVPKERFDSVNNELASMRERLELMEQNNALAKANAPQQTGPAFDILEQAGVSGEPDEPVTFEQQKKISETTTRFFAAQLEDLRFHIERPDFTEIVGTSEQIRAGQFAEPLAKACKENPALLPTILGSQNPKGVAYAIAKEQMRKAAKTKDQSSAKNDDPSRIIDEAVANAARVKSSASVKGGGALSEEGRFTNMSDEDFQELARKNGANL